jgi:hypothetical protein
LAWFIKKSENATMERGGKGFLRLLFGRKSMHFSVIRYCEECMGKSNAEKKSRKGLSAKISANNLCQRKLL